MLVLVFIEEIKENSVKIITWKELLERKGDRVWSPFDSDYRPTILYDTGSLSRLCEEDFPITKPDYTDCHNHFDTLDKFDELKSGTVSTLETCGDNANREDDDYKVVLFEKKDISKRKKKLQSLDIK